MKQLDPSEKGRWLLIVSVVALGLVSLVQPGCDCSTEGSFAPSSPTPAGITAVAPAQSSDSALVSSLVSVVFSDDMNESTIDTSTFTLTTGGAPVDVISVTYDATTRTATLTPAADLISSTEYIATISATVETLTGETPLASDFVWSFTISQATELMSGDQNGVAGNNASELSALDGSGRYVVFESSATNLAPTLVTNNRNHIYRKDSLTGEVLLVSSNANGLEADNNSSSPRISDGGRYVVFESTATNLDAALNSGGTSQIYLKDLDDGSVDLVSRSATLEPDNSFSGASRADVSNDGRFIVFQSSDNDLSSVNGGGEIQVYLKDMTDESVEMISRTSLDVAGNGASTDPYMSPDGRFIVFSSRAINLTGSNSFQHIYLVDTTVTHTVEQISVDTNGIQANADCNRPSVSDDGSIVVFDTLAVLSGFDNNGTTDVYYRDRTTPLTELVSANPTTQNSGNGASTSANISGDGDFVTFESIASDLVLETVFNIRDIFIRDLSQSSTIVINKVNLSQTGSEATINSSNPAISSDGRYVSFDSAYNYDITDTNTIIDVYRSHNSTF